ncbi:MAG: type IX secretion system protein PorQ [Ignavibacteria bacterium]|nr:type IX secretion system protein PorQ [Ignavibacteria bacterium]
MKYFLSAIAMVVCITTFSYSQNVYEFLRLDVSPRAAGMGGSLTSANDDPDVIFYNPAGLAFQTGTPVSFSFVKHLLDVNVAGLSVMHNYPEIGFIGASIKYVNYGSFEGRNEFGEEEASFGAADMAMQLSYANFLDENISYGMGIEFIYSSIQNYSSTGLATNFGLNYSIPGQRMNFGISLLHAGTQLSRYDGVKENLPLDLRIGFSKKLQFMPLKYFIDFQRLNDKTDAFFDRFKNFTIGGEFTLGKSFKLRLGLDNQKRTDLKIANYSGLAGFNIGVGFNVKQYQVNYAFTSLGQVGALHRIGISTNFEN